MREAQESILAVVTEFVNDRRLDYISLLNDVERELNRFKDNPEFRDAIYRIYSRKDKQVGGYPLKTDWKIAEKLSRLRADKPQTSVSSIHDIIGVTVVTYFTSQRDFVSKALETPNSLRELDVGQREEKNDKGYHAVHFVATSTRRAFHNLSCEIQVKTLLDDGWAAKIHDVSYKPKSDVPIKPELKAQIDILGDSVRLIERQSDIVKNLIEHEWRRDKKRRAAAQQEILLALTEDPVLNIDADISNLTKSIRADFQEIKSCDNTLTKYFELWRGLAKVAHSMYSCRLITLLASAREASDLNNVALTAINEWITQASSEEKMRAYDFRALASYAFGLFSNAVAHAEVALKYANDNNLATGSAKMNLAYFITENFYHSSGRNREEDFTRVKTLLSEAEPSFTGNRRPKFDDTQGAIDIAFSQEEQEIRQGLHLCHEACAAALGSAEWGAAEAFYRLHEHRACCRLLEWE